MSIKRILRSSVLWVLLALTPAIAHSQALFEPPTGKNLLILGQDLGAIGGFDNPNNDGYVDNLSPVPGGVTTYTSINNLEGLVSLVNYGSGDVCARCILQNSTYNNSVIVIGLYMVGILDEINNGEYDNSIQFLGNWIKETNRPVFLRIGYEFNNSWTGYDPTAFKAAWIRIYNSFKLNGVDNAALVWQSDGTGTASSLLPWYPGDIYVDWMGYSHFHNYGEGILELAEQKNKPVMIAESTPRGADLKDGNGTEHWNNWFQPLFDHIASNPEIKALAYINVNWDSQPMWAGQGWGDSRIQEDPIVSAKWLTEIAGDQWLNSSPELFDMLGYNPSSIPESELKQKTKAFISGKQLKVIFDQTDSDKLELGLYDITGKLLEFRQVNKPSGPFGAEIPMHTLKPGVYILKISNHLSVWSQKILYSDNF